MNEIKNFIWITIIVGIVSGLISSAQYFIKSEIATGFKTLTIAAPLYSVSFGFIVFFLILGGIKGVKKIIAEEKQFDELNPISK